METITLKIPVLVNSGCTYKPNEKFYENKGVKNYFNGYLKEVREQYKKITDKCSFEVIQTYAHYTNKEIFVEHLFKNKDYDNDTRNNIIEAIFCTEDAFNSEQSIITPIHEYKVAKIGTKGVLWDNGGIYPVTIEDSYLHILKDGEARVIYTLIDDKGQKHFGLTYSDKNNDFSTIMDFFESKEQITCEFWEKKYKELKKMIENSDEIETMMIVQNNTNNDKQFTYKMSIP